MTEGSTPVVPASPTVAKPAPASRVSWPSLSPLDVLAAVAVLAVFGFAYAPNIASLISTWNREPDYSHGFLVLPIALVILWKRWPKPGTARIAPWPAAWLFVVAALASRIYLHERGANWTETATLLPVLVGLVMARVGWRFVRRTWPAFAFLVFWFPLPPALSTALSQPLQAVATSWSCRLLRLSGLWVMPEGNVILVGNERLEVAAACNGLSMLMSLAATVAATASLIPISNLKRGALLLTIIPIALFSNILRIVATAWCYHQFGAVVGAKYAHDAAGWLMMPTAMGLVFLELAVISWLIIEVVEGPKRSEGSRLLETNRASLNYGGRSS